MHGVGVESLRHELLVLLLLVVVAAERYLPADASEQLFADYVGSEAVDANIGLDGAHAASDVDSYGVWHYNALGGEHSADGHAFASVGIGHEGDVVVYEGEEAEVFHFLACMFVDACGPVFYDYVVNDFCSHDYCRFFCL